MNSNSTIWSDELVLITQTATVDSDGYETYSETSNSIFCNFSEGVSTNEFYSHNKNGYQRMAQAEVNYFEYNGEKLAEHNSVRYDIIRSYPVDTDTTRLVLSEKML